MRAGRPLVFDRDDWDDEGEGQNLPPRREPRENRGRYDRYDRDDRRHYDDRGRGDRDHDDRGGRWRDDRDDRGGGRDDRRGYGNRDGRDQRFGGRNDRGMFVGRGGQGDRERFGERGGNNNRGGRGGGGRRDKPLVVGFKFLENLQQREPPDIVLTLSNPNTGFREGLLQCVEKPEMLRLMLHVLAKAFTCNSTPEQLLRVYVIIKECQFFDTSMAYFLEMQNEDRIYAQKSFRQPIKDMITIMEELAQKYPTSVTQFVGIHAVLKMVIDDLRENSDDVIDDELLKGFREFTEHRDRLIKRGTRRREDTARHRQDDVDEPPDDFREIQIFPQTADMQPNDDRYLRVNKIEGHYNDLDHYLDVQFRLLREDFVAPLREGVSDYIQVMQERGKKKRKIQDVRIYNNVRLIAPDCGESGLCHVLQFDVSGFSHVRWNSTKRLIYGSLVCLSPDNFASFFFATVVNREPKQLMKGLVNVRFEHDYQTVRHLFGQVFTMAETTAYFESYRHVLTGLQRTRQGDLPFERYIIQCESRVRSPAYLQRAPDTSYDLRPLVDEDIILKDDRRLGENIGEIEAADAHYQFTDRSDPAKDIKVLERSTWPPADLLHLDDSQYKAIHTALTKEFVITQGPPGTGKTYIGLKIVKALLHNKEVWSRHPETGAKDLRPMLIVCYTNHALDQFLEGIVQFYKGDVLRIGGRSTSDVLKEYNLYNFRQRFRHAQKIPVAIFQGRREAKNEMDAVTAEINKVSAKIQIATTCILREDFLQPFMGQEHFLLLTQQFDMLMQVYPEARQFVGKNHSIIVEWLELGNLSPIVEMEGNLAPEIGAQEIPNDEEQDELIDVEDELDAIQANRQIDAGDDEDADMDDLFDEIINADHELTRKELNEIRVRLAVSEQQKAVALSVERMGDKPKHVQEGEWQTTKQQRKKLKQKVLRNLASGDKMTEEEAQRITDMWRLAIKDKWRLYRMWVQKYCDYLMTQIGAKQEEFEAAAGRYREALMQEDKEIMRHSTIIGMTTTGAARYQAILQEIGPRIIVVEEAAEVLEAHIVTTLSRGCEHLILIGDHKQLKPNPTVYKLATDYSLDVSLFERMIKNGIKCDCLELQHRMRPEIAELMHHIYTSLKDHDDVKQYANIQGISKNIFFVDHKNEETHDEDLRSHSNRYEAEYIVALCKYLLLQGYKPTQITVLTLYSGQLFCLREMMPKEDFDGVRVTVVDNYQGEENDIILLSLVRSNEEGNIGFLKIENRVCVALSRAKKGFFAIGNFELLRDRSKLWNEVVIDMKTKGRLGDGLVLYCQNHPDEDGLVARQPGDFLKAPEGGCNKKCNYRLDCGHVCEMYCHVIDQEHKEYICRKRCGKVICQNGHRCRKICDQKCGPCLEKIAKKIPRCGHIQQVPCSMNASEFECKEECKDTLPCGHKCQSKCGMAHTEYCNVTVENTWPCGHKGNIKCYQRYEAACPKPCDAILGCEHRCQGTCGKCFQGRLHMPCKNDCIRILVCGHECSDTCNQCPPCKRKCENRCQHSKCNKRCGELCVPCMELCTWRCEHYRCERLCSEPCDRPRCDQPCRKVLPCNHQCIGLCGEPCPTDCRICDKQKVTELLFGEEDEPWAKFVLLEDCKLRCIIESNAMDRYMDMGEDRGEIKLKDCPKCKTPIRKSNRYRKIINKTLQDIEAVKRNVLVNKDRITKMETELKDVIAEETSAGIRLSMKRRLNAMHEPKAENELAAMLNQMMLLKHLTKVEENWKELHGIAFAQDKAKAVKFLDQFREWILVERTIMTPQETNDAELELARSKAHLKLLLHQQKARELGKTIDHKLKVKITEAETLVTGSKKYEERIRITVEKCLAELKEAFPLSALGISDDERLMIVKAMALPQGHWFRCPKGHVYAIADCGGATVEGQCPECGSTIGGSGHRLRDDNRFFGEMDGAQHPAWSEQANLGNYGFDAQF
ncbi:NFX1-type zinc finger-containing protein 1-like isoform X2 [Mercenaria mercenaria]|nr:NFX1-type zinc finger-containing protein 1-like isoform X2 [Mercenaria mercenaria]